MRGSLLISLLILSAFAPPARSETPPRNEDLFKWGEYDSLIRVLEPATRGEAKIRTLEDSLYRAKSFLFLGVAFYATGKRSRAEEAFLRAVELDPQVQLDRFYVTEEIANHFQAIALEQLRRQAAARPAASLPVVAAPPPIARKAPAVVKPAKSRKWVWFGVGLAGLATAVGGGYWLLSGDEEPDHTTTVNFGN